MDPTLSTVILRRIFFHNYDNLVKLANQSSPSMSHPRRPVWPVVAVPPPHFTSKLQQKPKTKINLINIYFYTMGILGTQKMKNLI